MTVRQLHARLFKVEDQDAEASPDLIRRLLGEGTPHSGRSGGVSWRSISTKLWIETPTPSCSTYQSGWPVTRT